MPTDTRNFLKKLCKQKERHFRSRISSNIEELNTNDVKEYWNLIKSLKENDEKAEIPEYIKTNDWYEYFKSLYGTDPENNASPPPQMRTRRYNERKPASNRQPKR